MRSIRAVRYLFVMLMLVFGVGCGDTTTQPAQAQQVAASTNQELLLEILNRLDQMESRFEEETAVLHARLDSAAAAGEIVTAVGGPAGGRGPPENRGGNSLSSQIATVESRTDSIMTLVDFLAQGSTQAWQGFTVCGGLGTKGEVALKSWTLGKASGEGGVGVKPWDTGAQAKVEVEQRGMVDVGVGGDLQFGVNGCVDLSKVGTEPPLARSLNSSFAMRPGAVAGAEQLESTLISLSSRLGFTTTEVEQAMMLGTEIVESGDFTRLADLPSMLPVPPSLNDPLSMVRGRLRSIDPVDLLCSGGNFGTRIQSRVSEACQLIRDDNLPDLGTFASLDLDSFDVIENACDGRGVESCLALLDARTSRLCRTTNSMRSKLAEGIFHSRDDFRLKIWQVISGEEGNRQPAVTGVPSLRWNCSELIG